MRHSRNSFTNTLSTWNDGKKDAQYLLWSKAKGDQFFYGERVIFFIHAEVWSNTNIDINSSTDSIGSLLQKTAFSVVKSRFAPGSPGWVFVCLSDEGVAVNNNTGYGWKSETYFHLLVGWIQRLPWTFRRYFRWTWGPCNVAEVNTKMFWLFSVFKVLCFTGTMKYLGMGCWTRRIRTPGSVKIGLAHLPLLSYYWWIQRQKVR